MKSLITVILCALIANFCSAATTAYTATEGGRAWSYTLDGSGNATLTAVDNASGDLTLPSSLDGHTVTAVGDKSFQNLTQLKTLIVSDSIMTIGYGAFGGCTSLGDVDIGNGVTSLSGSTSTYFSQDDKGVFNGCVSLTNVVFGTGLHTIGGHAFANCTRLTNVTVPNAVETIGNNSFYNCTAMRNVFVGNGIKSIGTYAFHCCTGLTNVTFAANSAIQLTLGNYVFNGCTALKTVSLPESLTSIGEYAFANCTSLKALRLPDSLTTIAEGAFGGCTALGDVAVGNGVTSFGGSTSTYYSQDDHGVFNGCTSLTNVTFGTSLRTIGGHAFANCTRLAHVAIPDNVETIGNNSFYKCAAIRDVAIGAGVKSVGTYAFQLCTAVTNLTFEACDTPQLTIADYAFNGCTKLETVSLPESLIEIGEFAFADCLGLRYLRLPDSLTSVSMGAFGRCTSLGEVQMGNGVKTLLGSTSHYYSQDDSGVFNGCASLTNVIFGSSLKTIGGHAFANCTRLARVDIPDNVETIANNSFYKCTSVREVAIGNGIKTVGTYAFQLCTGISNVTFAPSTVPQLTIGNYAFNGCTSLMTVTLPESLTAIGEYAFANCSSLKALRLPDSLTTVAEGAFGGCTALDDVVTGNGVTSFGGSTSTYYSQDDHGVFNGCTSLTNVTFGTGLRTIGGHAFANCTRLSHVAIPDNVETIGNNCFYKCTAICDVAIGAGVKSVGTYAFQLCTGITDVTFASCTVPQLTIGNYTFNGCTALKTVSLPESLTSIGEYAFANCTSLKALRLPDSLTTIAEGAFGGCTALGDVAVGNGVTSFGGSTSTYYSQDDHGVFNGCTALTNLTLGTGLRTIGGHAFANCTSLPRVVIPDNVDTIGNNCFYSCKMLGSVTFGSWVTSIGAYAFAQCPCLRYLHFRGEPPTTVDDNAFDGMKSAVVIYVPSSAEGWSATWNGHTVKKTDEIPADADAPWDLVAKVLYLTDATNSYTSCSSFLEGNPVYVCYGFEDIWADADITDDIVNTLSLESTDRIYRLRWHGLQAGKHGTAYWRLPDMLQRLPVGDYSVRLSLNDLRGIRETNYANNTNHVSFSVVPATEITFMSLEYEVAVTRFAKGGTYASLPTAPVRLGYRFLGWFTDEKKGIEVTTSSRVPDVATTLYAHWIAAPNETVVVSENLTRDATWQSGNLYVVNQTLTVPSGVTLTVMPGAIVKFAHGTSLKIASGATLRAEGTRVMPIYFTSIDDDEQGGMTDGSDSMPNAGDWYQIGVSGTATFKNCHVFYNSSVENHGGLECLGGDIVFDDSEIANTLYECVNMHGGGHFAANNSVFRDSSLAFGYYGGSNVKVVNCVVAYCTTAVRQSSKRFFNTIFYNCKNFTDQGGAGSKFQYCCFYNPSGFGDQNSATYNRDTCIWADPQFLDPESNDFRIEATSPCVDAGDGAEAPATDHYGSPRMDVATVRNTGTAAANGACPDIGIYEVEGDADIPAADLTVTSVMAPETFAVGETIRVSWTVQNVGTVDATGTWRDTVELVTANGQALELGTTVATLPVAAGESSTFTDEYVVPSGCEGVCQVRVTANGQRDLFEAGASENNVGTSDDCELTVGTLALPTDGTESPLALGAGTQTAFALDYDTSVPAVILVRSTGDVSAWLGNGMTAMRDNAVRTAVKVADDLWLLEVPAGTEARVSVSNDGLEPASVNLSLATGEFFLLDVEKSSAANSGSVTVPFCGNGFTDGMTCWLSKNGTRVKDASEVIVSDALHGSAVIDVSGLSAGTYRLHLKKGDDEVFADLLTLTAVESAQAHWNCGLVLAESVRANRVYVGKFGYENIGNASKPAPYVTLKGSGGTLLRLSEADAWAESVDVLAISPTYPASSVKPGESNEITFYYKTSGETANVTFECAGATRIVAEDGGAVPLGYLSRGGALMSSSPQSGQVIDSEVIEVTAHYKVVRYTVLVVVSKTEEPVGWADLSESMRPARVPQKAWNVAFPKMTRSFGSTWKSYIAKLAADADYLMKLGQPTYRVDRLLRLEMNEALGTDLAVPKLASATDLVRTGRGPALSFSRSYSTSLTERQTKGALGYGWSHGYDVSVEEKDETTLVFHLPGGSSYTFTKASGAWAPEDARDRSTLTETDAAYVLTALDGTAQTFAKSTLRLSSITDNQGHSTVFTWSGDKLIRAVHSDGQSLDFSYTGDLLASVADDLGHVVAYGYANERLTSVTRPDGLVTRYNYRTDTDGALAHALVQTIAADGTTRDFTWDENGRIATMSVNGTHQTTTVRHGSYGSYVLVAPNGAETTVTVGVNGETLKTVNALGETVSQNYTDDSLLQSTVAPSGKRNKITYDKYGSPISSMSASGATTTFAYTDAFGSLASVTDAKGHAFNYGYDDKGRSTSVGYADGSSSTLVYNEKGDVVKSTNRRGESVTYAYDAKGNLIRKTWDNGRTFALAYDEKGNVTNATDSVTGAVTMEYDANERLTKIVYPKNRGFTFKYDAAGRQVERAALDGTKECYEYDAFGRLARVTDGTKAYLTNAYDPTTGWLVTQTYGNGAVVSNAYDLLGRTIGIYHLVGSAPRADRLAFFEYAYDIDGKCISQTTAEGVERYAYDADGQLTAVTYPDGTFESFAYDAVGNRTTANGATYTVNNLNQYTTIVDATPSSRQTTLNYDLDGNLVSRTADGSTTTYAYDTLNRLIAVTNAAKNIRWSCEYDVFGNRVSVTDNGTTTEKLFVQGSLASVAAEYVDGALTKRHVVVGAVRLADVESGTTRYYHGDMIGSTRLTTDAAGAQQSTVSYKAFGAIRKSTGTQTDAGYVGTLGIETDANGFLFMRNRYYDAGMGRFVQMDPIGLKAGDNNAYRYCQNAPLVVFDSTGCWFEKLDGFGDYLWNNTKDMSKWMWNNFKEGDWKSFCKGAGLGYDTGRLVTKAIADSHIPIWSQKAKLLDMTLDGIEFNYNLSHGFGQIAGGDMAGGLLDWASLGWDQLKPDWLDYAERIKGIYDDVVDIKDYLHEKLEPDQVITEYRTVKISWDPNEMSGPAGVGEKRYVQQGEWMNYTIYFENKTNATAAAQEVFVDLPMDENLDWSTLELGEIAFGEHIDSGLSGKSHGTSSYANPGTNTFVKTTVTQKGGVLSWYIRDWDPTTADNFPTSVEGGFLPPNDPAAHCGEGHVSYRVRVKDTAANGAIIRASAQIVFDSNPMIETDPAWWNTVGEDAPAVNFTVSELEANEGSNLIVTVSGGDAEKAAYAQVYLAYQTAAAADIDLKTAKVDGVTPKGGIKFPLTLNWAAGSVTNHVISIPVKTDKTVEDDETLVFQLAAAQGQELGEVTTCAVTIRDANVAADYAAKQAKETVKTKKGVETNALAVACVAGDGSGTVCGYTTGQGKYSKGSKASLKATARPGWEFKGWYAVTNDVGGGLIEAALPDGALVSRLASLNLTLTNDAEIVALFGRIPYVAGLASPADGGKVAGSGYCAAGKKVTLKATANKNFTFTGWVAATSDAGDAIETIASTPIMTPTLVFDRSAKPAKSDAKQTVITDISESVTYYATFKSDPTVYVYLTADDGATAPGKVTGAGKYAAGKKKIALKATANKGYVFVGWYDGAVSASGEAGVLALPDPVSRLASYTLAEMPTNDVELTAMFITSGLDKSNIVAKVNGMAFETTVGGGTPTLPTNIWTGVYLEWPVAASALSATTVKVAGLPSGLKFTAKDVTQKIGSGKTAQTVVVVPANTIYGAPSAASKTAKDKKTGTVSVTPSTVKITVTTAGKSSQIYQINTTVDPLPSWVQGTFTGPSYSDAIETIASTGAGDGVYTNGLATVTIAASGKISAKQPVNGKSTSFAASYFDSYVADENAFYATLTAKVGKEVVTNKMGVCGHAGRVTLPTGDDQVVTNGYIEADRFDAWQYNWKSEPWKMLIKPLDKTTFTYVILSDGMIVDENDGGEGLAALPGNVTGADGVRALPVDGLNVIGKVTLKFAASGSVAVSGEFVSGYDSKKAKYTTVKATGSTIIVPGEDDQGLVFVYLTPKGISAHVRCVKIPWSEE